MTNESNQIINGRHNLAESQGGKASSLSDTEKQCFDRTKSKNHNVKEKSNCT